MICATGGASIHGMFKRGSLEARFNVVDCLQMQAVEEGGTGVARVPRTEASQADMSRASYASRLPERLGSSDWDLCRWSQIYWPYMFRWTV